MDAKTVLTDIRCVVGDVPGIDRVNGSRKHDAPATGKFTASVLYRGEALERWIINDSSDRTEHLMPVAVDIRTTGDDDGLIDKVYAVLDAVCLPANRPTDVISLLPESIDEPDGEEYLSCRINLIAKFRRS